jgi:hypothetical protein
MSELAASAGLRVEPGFKIREVDGTVLWEKFTDVEFLEAFVEGYKRGLLVKRA